ncbi:MAG TPA: aspartate aminotransferase family protein [Bryobacteraceae bacterium]|nr:aspartate aminotransferase family protein [Bryobacteraceae bacterium]
MFASLEIPDLESPLEAREGSLDPPDWYVFRAQAHRMLDDMLDYTEYIRERPVWQPIPLTVRKAFRQPFPQKPVGLESAHEIFMRHILPYAVGNVHPGFMGWVHGGGTPAGMLAEMLAAGLNANLGGRDQIPIEVERQVVQWVRELFGFPDTASGLFVTGTSMANLIAVLVARTSAGGDAVRQQGVNADGGRLVAYTSEGAHGSIAQAMDLTGLGKDALRIIPMNPDYQMDLRALESALDRDRAAGLVPFLIAATAGTVDVGAIDDLKGIARIAEREKVWFHVDGAFGALAMLAPDLSPLLAGIEQADSVAFDFNKWGQVPYDAGFVLVRDGAIHQATFASPTAYLRREKRGMAAGSPWPCDFGPDLSRGFRALKTWFTIQTFGAQKLGAMISKTCLLARHLKQRVEDEPRLELLAPVALNIVCFRYRAEYEPDEVNRNIVCDLQESGIAAPSTTVVNGRLAIRAAIVNHRTERRDIDAMIKAVLALGPKNER